MKSFKSKFSKQLDQFSFFDNNYSSGLIAALHILKYPKYPWTRSGVMQDSKLMSETKIKIHFGWNDGFYLHIISILDYSIYVLVGGNGTPLQYSCLENPMDRGGWWATVHGVVKSQTRLSDFTFPFHFHALEKEMATHSTVLAWRIPGMESLVGCRLWGRRRSDTTEAT